MGPRAFALPLGYQIINSSAERDTKPARALPPDRRQCSMGALERCLAKFGCAKMKFSTSGRALQGLERRTNANQHGLGPHSLHLSAANCIVFAPVVGSYWLHNCTIAQSSAAPIVSSVTGISGGGRQGGWCCCWCWCWWWRHWCHSRATARSAPPGHGQPWRARAAAPASASTAEGTRSQFIIIRSAQIGPCNNSQIRRESIGARFVCLDASRQITTLAWASWGWLRVGASCGGPKRPEACARAHRLLPQSIDVGQIWSGAGRVRRSFRASDSSWRNKFHPAEIDEFRVHFAIWQAKVK